MRSAKRAHRTGARLSRAQVLAKDMIVTLNLLQHDGCDPHSPVNHSRNFVGPILNFLCFNNGARTGRRLSRARALCGARAAGGTAAGTCRRRRRAPAPNAAAPS